MAKQAASAVQDRGCDSDEVAPLADLLPSIRDPYLADSLGEFVRLAEQLRNRNQKNEAREILRDTFYVCEVTRDATMHFLPYSVDDVDLLKSAAAEYRAVVQAIHEFDLPDDIRQKIDNYAGHIQERVVEYTKAIKELGVLVPA